jgi:sensor histidine kinase regulating citrate/malate metabolism
MCYLEKWPKHHKILGNLLENTVTAPSRAEKGNRYIHLNLLYTAQILIVTVDNFFTGEIKKRETFASPKNVMLKLKNNSQYTIS